MLGKDAGLSSDAEQAPISSQDPLRTQEEHGTTHAPAGSSRASDWTVPSERIVDPNPGLLRTGLHIFYDVAWLVALVVASPWLVYRSMRAPAFGTMVLERLGRGLGKLPPPTRRRVLIHGVSVGEVKAALPLVRAIESAHPSLEVLISTTTNTGLEVAEKLFPGNLRVRFPADISWVVRRFLRRTAPDVVLLVELEIWPNFLRACNRQRKPVIVVNGRITEMSHGHYLVSRKVLPQFNRISLYCVQLDEYAQRFRRLGVAPERILITGNIKVDGLPTGTVDPGEELRKLLGPAPGQHLIVGGSTHAEEELLLAEAWRNCTPGARLVLVPRHPHRCAGLITRLEAHGFRAMALSELRSTGGETPGGTIVLVDSIGELERIFGLADVVFMGGSLVPHGGQNLLEPASQGRAVLFGPYMKNFAQEVAILRQCGGARRVEDEGQLGEALRELLGDAEERERMGQAALSAVRSQGGATAETLRALDAISLDKLASEPAWVP